jgi:hypothetical protein
MERKKVEETIHTIDYNFEDAPLKVCDIPKDLLPDDKIYYQTDAVHWSEDNSWNPFTEYRVVRLRDQTDEEYQKDVEFWEKKKEESRIARYTHYLQLKKEVEEGKLTRAHYVMDEGEKRQFDLYSEMRFLNNKTRYVNDDEEKS